MQCMANQGSLNAHTGFYAQCKTRLGQRQRPKQRFLRSMQCMANKGRSNAHTGFYAQCKTRLRQRQRPKHRFLRSMQCMAEEPEADLRKKNCPKHKHPLEKQMGMGTVETE